MKKIVFIILFFCFFALHWKKDLLAETVSETVIADPFLPITSFQVASLFYKLCDSAPDFKKWAMETDAYKKAADFDKPVILAQEENRLRMDFANFDAKKPFSIYFNVKLNQYSNAQESFFFPEISKDTYLPYTYQGEEYIILLADIEKFSSVPISKIIANRIKSEDVKAEFTVVATKAEGKEPVMIHDKNRWAIIGQIAEFKLWNHNRTTLYFSERASWYNPRNKLLDLYKK